MNKYRIIYKDKEEGKVFFLHAMTEDDALEVFRRNFGPHPEAVAMFIRPTTKWELEQIEGTGGPSPRKRSDG